MEITTIIRLVNLSIRNRAASPDTPALLEKKTLRKTVLTNLTNIFICMKNYSIIIGYEQSNFIEIHCQKNSVPKKTFDIPTLGSPTVG